MPAALYYGNCAFTSITVSSNKGAIKKKKKKVKEKKYCHVDSRTLVPPSSVESIHHFLFQIDSCLSVGIQGRAKDMCVDSGQIPKTKRERASLEKKIGQAIPRTI